MTGKRDAVYVIRKLKNPGMDSIEQGDRIVKVDHQELTAEEIVRQLEEHVQQPVSITYWKATHNFASNLKQYMHLSAEITSYSYLEEDALLLQQWQAEMKFIDPNESKLQEKDAQYQYLEFNQNPGITVIVSLHTHERHTHARSITSPSQHTLHV